LQRDYSKLKNIIRQCSGSRYSERDVIHRDSGILLTIAGGKPKQRHVPFTSYRQRRKVEYCS